MWYHVVPCHKVGEVLNPKPMRCWVDGGRPAFARGSAAQPAGRQPALRRP